MLDTKIQTLKDYFGIAKPADWSDVPPASILALDGIGPATLDYLRVLLANRELTLKNDRTPEYWRQNLDHVKVSHQLGDDDIQLVTPFTILIDSAEQHPFDFAGIKSDADRDGRPWLVATRWEPLGRHPDSLGDYSLDGFVGRVAVERKSVEDCQGTILGFGRDGEGTSRRDRFESELANLQKCDASLVVVEGTLETVLQTVEQRGKKTRGENAKTLLRSIIAYQQDYGVSWQFCDGRRLAETYTFRFLERFWKQHSKEAKEVERLVAAL